MLIFSYIFAIITLLFIPFGCIFIYKKLANVGKIKSKKLYHLAIVAVLAVIVVCGLYCAYYIVNDTALKSHDIGYSEGVQDCEETITEGIAKGDTPSGDIIYYTESGTVIHKSPNCQYLKNSDKVLNAPKSSKSDWKKCSKCW